MGAITGIGRRLSRALRAVVTAPPFVGALVVLGLAAMAGQRGSGDDADLGDLRRAEAVESFVEHRFASELWRMKIGIVATAIALGLIVGLVAEVLIRLRRSRSRKGTARAFVETALVCFGVHASFMLWAMADSPQLYAARWYAKGGLARTTQVFATDVLGPHGVIVLAILAAIAYVRPTRLAYLAHRAMGLVRRPLRVVAIAVAKRAASPMIALLVAALALRSVGRPGDAEAAPGTKPDAGVKADAGIKADAGTKAPPPKPKPATSSAPTPALPPLPRVVREHPASTPSSAVAPTSAPAPALASAPAPALASAPAPALASAPAPAPSSSLASASAPRSPNILIIAADSLRADRLNPNVAPTLSRLADRGTRFDRAYVSIPRTFPSWVTILTGRHSHHHGIRSMFPTWDERARDFDALPERFAQAGYATGVVSDYAGDIFGRIDLGFARVDTPTFDFRQLIRQRALERETPLLPLLHSQLGRRLFPVMRELNDAADPNLLAEDVNRAIHALKDKPFFLTVFFSTAHFPYAAPAPYYAKYTDPNYRGRFKYHKPVGLGEDTPPDAADLKQIRALYDGSVNAIDDAVARVLASLEREGLADDTIIVVTADHGETLYDHGHGQGHGDHLFGDEGTHVPLVVYDPRLANQRGGGGGARVDRVARDVDIAPTLYELAGLTAPSDLDGRSLVPALLGGAIEPAFAYAETELWFTEDITGLEPDLRMPYPGIVALTEIDNRHNAEIVFRREMIPLTRMARHRMIRDERWKLVYVPTRKGVKYMLFDTLADPDETHDVSATQPDELLRLRTDLWAWMLRDPQMEQKDGFLVPRDPGAMSRPRATGSPP